MKLEDIDLKWLERYKVPALALLVLACVAAAVMRDFVGVHVMSYIHIFYIPAIVAALWFGRRAFYLAVVLAAAEMSLNFANIGVLTPIMVIDGLALVIVTATIGVLSENASLLNARLKDSDRLLQLSEDSYRTIFNAASDGILLYDPAIGRLRDANEAWVQLTGYGVDETTNLTMSRLSALEKSPGDPEIMRYVTEALRGNGQLFQWKIRRKDGSMVWAEINLKRISLAEGTFLVAIVRDIGERKRAEEALSESEAKFRALTESTASAIVIVQDDRVKYANPAVEKIVGYTVSEMVAMSPLEAVSVIEPASILRLNLVRFRRKGSRDHHRYEIRLRAKDGQKKWVDVTTGMISYNGRPAFLATGFDITERKRAEEKLRASLQEKEVLLKEVHHRVKNNLQVVSSMLNLQSMNANDPAIIRMLQESQDRVRSMALIHEKLYRAGDFSRIDFGEYAHSLSANLLRSYTAGRTVKLNIDVYDILLSIDMAIPCGLIVNELVTNALKHAFPDGRAGTVTVAMRREGSEYVLVVKDDGVGMPPHVDHRNSGSFGLQLVETLAGQLEGSIGLDGNDGTAYTIRFADRSDRETNNG